MISVYKEYIKNIPSLIVVEANRKVEALPIITYFHGFTSAKEHNLPLAYLLAEKGYRVVLPDSEYHGEREIKASSETRQYAFWEIIIQNVNELKDIKEYLDGKGLVQHDRFGVAGTSMGGITTSAALTQYTWIKSAAVLMGTPKITAYAKALVDNLTKSGDLQITEEQANELYGKLEQYDLSKQLEKLNQRPLMFWHGDKDKVVPFDHSYTFYEEASRLYKATDTIKFLKESNRDHKVSRFAVLETAKWFEKHL
ncbi:prolyl oligopeptidase family serine peptidase [Virgibacillus sp. C22-A2]|uniref:Prolyl oligopeptidase family serine peptidase n=1 Tax=Virgibacillus tibetensis TaxID=3042313 RepID=A0ABU6KES1_9BACI|nr:prolyl oligopeptidase family serine peptidase [Virgibacillus sp. C22-A2]